MQKEKECTTANIFSTLTISIYLFTSNIFDEQMIYL